jgi:hypothetical protein
VEGTKNEELANVHVVVTRMKPIDLDKNLWRWYIPNSKQTWVCDLPWISWAYFKNKTFNMLFKSAMQFFHIFVMHPIVAHGVLVGFFASKLCINGHYANVGMQLVLLLAPC